MNPAPTPPRRRLPWRLMPICILAGLLLATVFALRQPDLFTSQAVLVRPAKVHFAGASPVREDELSTEQMLAMMKTEIVINRVLAKLQENRDNTNALIRPTYAARPGAGNMFVLTVTTTNFDYAQKFVTAWAGEFVEFHKEQRRGMVGTTKAQTEQQILYYERKLEQALQALDSFRRKQGVFNQADAGASRLAGLEKMQQELLALDLERDQISAARPEVGGGNAARTLDLRFDVKRAENRLAAVPVGASAEVQAQLEAELKLKQADLAAFLALLQETQRDQLQAIDIRQAALRKKIEQLRLDALESTDLQNQLARLTEDEQNIRSNLTELKRQLESTGRMAIEEDNIMIVQAGTGSLQPVGPNRPKILIVGFGLGGLTGLLLVGLRALFGGGGPGRPPGIPTETPAPVPA